jgi:hypothetical protein
MLFEVPDFDVKVMPPAKGAEGVEGLGKTSFYKYLETFAVNLRQAAFEESSMSPQCGYQIS